MTQNVQNGAFAKASLFRGTKRMHIEKAIKNDEKAPFLKIKATLRGLLRKMKRKRGEMKELLKGRKFAPYLPEKIVR